MTIRTITPTTPTTTTFPATFSPKEPPRLSRGRREDAPELILRKCADGEERAIPFFVSSEGQFNWFGLVPSDLPPLVEGVSNESLAIKVLKPPCHKRPLDGNSPTHIVEEKKKLKELGIDVAEIYNEDDFKNGCGYQIVENIPHPAYFFPADQMLALIELVYANGLCPDIKHDNFRLRNKDVATLTVVDFREIPPTASERGALFVSMIRDLEPCCSEGFGELVDHSDLLKEIYQPTSKSFHLKA